MVHRYGTSLLHGPAACGQNLPAAAALIPGLPSEGWKRKESNLKAFRTACSRNLSGAARRLDALLRGLGALDGKAPSAEAYRPEATARHLVDTRSLPEKGALLHFQAGDGGFLEGFHALRPQWELSAIESGADFMKLLDKEFLTAACNAGYRDADLSRAFDVIVVTKPLDTVDKPLEALRWLCRRLAEGGTFLPPASLHPLGLQPVRGGARHEAAHRQPRHTLPGRRTFHRISGYAGRGHPPLRPQNRLLPRALRSLSHAGPTARMGKARYVHRAGSLSAGAAAPLSARRAPNGSLPRLTPCRERRPPLRRDIHKKAGKEDWGGWTSFDLTAIHKGRRFFSPRP